MDNLTLHRDDAVLMITDIKERLVLVMKYKDQVIDNSKILITAAKEMNFPIIATEQYPKGLGKRLRKLQKDLSRKKKGSKNRQKARKEVEKITRKNIKLKERLPS